MRFMVGEGVSRLSARLIQGHPASPVAGRRLV